MARPRRSWIAAVLLLAALAGILLSLALWDAQRFAPPPISLVRSPLVLIVEMSVALVYALVGFVLAARRPSNPIGWLLLSIGVTTSLQFPMVFRVAATHEVLRPPDGPTVLAAWLVSSAHLPFVAAASILVFLLFPDGQLLTRRWGPARWFACGGAALVAAAAALSPDGLIWYPSLPNPVALPLEYAPAVSVARAAGLLMMVASLLCATGSLVARYRRAEPLRRTQLRLVAFAVVVLATLATPFLVVRYAAQPSYATGEALLAAMLIGAGLVPLAVGVAIFRYGLFEIDFILNRALVYVPLMGFAGGFYAASVALFQRVFVALTGNTSDAAIVFTTLILASFFTPVRKGLETLVDRAFRPRPGAPAPDAPGIVARVADDLDLSSTRVLERLAELETRLSRLELP